MTHDRKRTTVTCTQCTETFTLQDAELRRRLKKRVNGNGHLFCSMVCFQNYNQKRRLDKLQKKD